MLLGMAAVPNGFEERVSATIRRLPPGEVSTYSEIAEEDSGKAAPKRFFQRFFGGSTNSDGVKTLQNSETAKERAESV